MSKKRTNDKKARLRGLKQLDGRTRASKRAAKFVESVLSTRRDLTEPQKRDVEHLAFLDTVLADKEAACLSGDGNIDMDEIVRGLNTKSRLSENLRLYELPESPPTPADPEAFSSALKAVLSDLGILTSAAGGKGGAAVASAPPAPSPPPKPQHGDTVEIEASGATIMFDAELGAWRLFDWRNIPKGHEADLEKAKAIAAKLGVPPAEPEAQDEDGGPDGWRYI